MSVLSWVKNKINDRNQKKTELQELDKLAQQDAQNQVNQDWVNQRTNYYNQQRQQYINQGVQNNQIDTRTNWQKAQTQLSNVGSGLQEIGNQFNQQIQQGSKKVDVGSVQINRNIITQKEKGINNQGIDGWLNGSPFNNQAQSKINYMGSSTSYFKPKTDKFKGLVGLGSTSEAREKIKRFI